MKKFIFCTMIVLTLLMAGGTVGCVSPSSTPAPPPTQAPFGYLWDFGDTATSTERQPTHSYSTGGNYSVSLKVTDAKGNTSIEAKSNYIKVLSAAGWTPLKTVRSAWYGLRVVGRGLGNLAIWVAIYSPIWIPGGLVFWGVRRWRRRSKQARHT